MAVRKRTMLFRFKSFFLKSAFYVAKLAHFSNIATIRPKSRSINHFHHFLTLSKCVYYIHWCSTVLLKTYGDQTFLQISSPLSTFQMKSSSWNRNSSGQKWNSDTEFSFACHMKMDTIFSELFQICWTLTAGQNSSPSENKTINFFWLNILWNKQVEMGPKPEVKV